MLVVQILRLEQYDDQSSYQLGPRTIVVQIYVGL